MLESASRRGGLSIGGVSPSGGFSIRGGFSIWGGVSIRGGFSIRGVVSIPGGGMASQHALRQTPSPPCGQTDTCKNITLATTSLQPVNISDDNWFITAVRKVMFSVTSVSHSVHRVGVGVSTPLPPHGTCRIRLASGRYVSYWNAFLLRKRTRMETLASLGCVMTTMFRNNLILSASRWFRFRIQ